MMEDDGRSNEDPSRNVEVGDTKTEVMALASSDYEGDNDVISTSSNTRAQYESLTPNFEPQLEGGGTKMWKDRPECAVCKKRIRERTVRTAKAKLFWPRYQEYARINGLVPFQTDQFHTTCYIRINTGKYKGAPYRQRNELKRRCPISGKVLSSEFQGWTTDAPENGCVSSGQKSAVLTRTNAKGLRVGGNVRNPSGNPDADDPPLGSLEKIETLEPKSEPMSTFSNYEDNSDEDDGDMREESILPEPVRSEAESDDVTRSDNEEWTPNKSFYLDDEVNTRRRTRAGRRAMGNPVQQADLCRPVPKVSSRSAATTKCHACWKDISRKKGGMPAHFKMEHPDLDPCVCVVCGLKCSTLETCRHHAIRHLPGMQRWECSLCDKTYFREKELRRHVSDFHEKIKEPKPYSDLVIMCKTCGLCVSTVENFSCHNKKIHGGKAKCTKPFPEKDIEKKRKSLNIENPKIRNKCHVCWEDINVSGGTKSHFEQVHPGLDPNQCTKCGKRFLTYALCKNHALSHGNKTFQCDQCPSRFFSKNGLKLHSDTHIPADAREKHVCHICAKVLKSRATLNGHLLTHERDRRLFVCEICGNSYSQLGSYNYHKKKAHLKILPHKCPHCPKRFVRNCLLRLHLPKHTKERLFKCPLCPKTFLYSQGRDKHLQITHGKKKKNLKVNVTSLENQEAPEGSSAGLEVEVANIVMEQDDQQHSSAI